MEDKAVEWVDGLPPVGTVCEWCDYNESGHKNWKHVEIVGIHEGAYWMLSADGDYEIDTTPNNFEFRTIKTPKEKAIEEMLKIIMSSSGHAAGLIECINVARAMYEEGYHK